MPLAPIVLFVYNRPWHTRQTAEALQRCEFAGDSELYIFADGSKSDATEECRAKIGEVRNYIHTLSGFKKIHIEESASNNGLANSIIAGVTKVIEKHGQAIVVEDDIVCHPFFLRFMNEALAFYKDNQKVFAISATMERFAMPTDYSQDVFLTYRFGSWGWATWNNRWKTADWDIRNYNLSKKYIKRLCLGGDDLWPMLQAQANGTIDSWAVRFDYNMAAQGKMCLRPAKSLVSNIGMDGTGVHCGECDTSLLPLYDKASYDIHLPRTIAANRTIAKNIQSIFRQDSERIGMAKWTKHKIKKILIQLHLWHPTP